MRTTHGARINGSPEAMYLSFSCYSSGLDFSVFLTLCLSDLGGLAKRCFPC